MSRNLQMRRLAQLRRELTDDRIVEGRRDGHQWQREAIPGTAGGKALAASPVADPGVPGPPAVNLERGGPAGEIIHTSGTSDSITSGGDYLLADTELDRYGFSSNTLGDTYTLPRTATYKIELDFEWDDYHSGGTVAVEVNGTVVRTMLGTGPGRRLSWSPTFRAEKDDTVKVKVTQSSGSAETATFTITLAVVEPVRAIADPGWTKVATVDAYGIFNDGTSWWITQGQNGDLVSEYDSSWVLQSSFDAGYSHNRVRGVTDDGTDLYLTGNSGGNPDRIKQYTKAGVFVDEFSGGDLSVAGLAFDGTDLWAIRNDARALSRFTLAGSLEESITLPGARDGLAIYDGKFVLADAAGAVIEVRDRAGGLVKSIPTSGAIAGPTGVWVAADGTLYASDDGDGVYRWAGSL